ncbi:phage portal protein [Aquamicrobium defluvii]|uniref:Portal protein n=1 Tax=Aquamicrobium defluvii TaxID=69279 RepID=A0A011TAG8_9HYPH|nr:phage portal protein [Aquamicrobium defluvii]EXL08619.1 portal protein [Aquamicrobium defluvii]EZQ14869.1 portal protein [Halopseudomonas bauzanensis]
MKLFGFNIRREVRSATSPENETVPVSAENFLSFFGVQSVDLPYVTIDRALTVPAVAAAVAFLSRTLAALPLHAYQSSPDGAKRVTGKLGAVIHGNANDEMSSFLFRQYFWQQVFTGGRGLAWIERADAEIVNLWPMDPRKVTVKRVAGRKVYRFESKEYPAADVIDVPFMLKADQLSHYGPIILAAKAIQLALAMNDYGSNFFAGGGVPPLALSGPLPEGGPALKRAAADVDRAIKFAKDNKSPIMPIPAGHDLKPVGFDPAKGQMVEARLFQIQEIARAWQMPPAFLQDLSKGTFANVEQQDLHLVKHLIGQWAEAFEGEMNLKLFGREPNGFYVEHNLDGLMRGDFKSRVEGIARAIQTAQITPNEGRALENRPRHMNPDADELLVQGATVVLGKQPAATTADDIDGDKTNDEA